MPDMTFSNYKAQNGPHRARTRTREIKGQSAAVFIARTPWVFVILGRGRPHTTELLREGGQKFYGNDHSTTQLARTVEPTQYAND